MIHPRGFWKLHLNSSTTTADYRANMRKKYISVGYGGKTYFNHKGKPVVLTKS